MLPPYGIQPAAGRLPDATRLGRARLQVTDLARSLDFYRDTIGFHVLAHDAHEAALGAQGDGRVILELQAGATRPVPRGGRQGLFHFAILLPDRAALGRFLGHITSRGVPIGASDHLVSEAIYLSDPDGLGIEVYADRPRETWQHAGRELQMATVALDAQGVLASGADSAWTGMPAGTTLGHMHLHVGALEPARAFYHDALGLDLVVWSYPGALFFSAGGYHHHLGTNTWAARQPSAAPEEARLLDWELALPDAGAVEAVKARMSGFGFDALSSVRGASFVDPWGTQLTITSRP